MFPIMSESNRKPDSRESDPEKLAEQLEIELMMKRAAWQHAKTRRGNRRALSFAFLFLILIGALVGFYLLLSSDALQEMKSNAAEQRRATPTPTASPN